MDFITIAQKYWWFIVGPGVAVAGIALFYLRTQFATKSEFKTQSDRVNASLAGLREQIEDHTQVSNRRLQHLEGVTEHLPDKDAFHRLALQVERQNGEISALREMQKGTNSGVKRIEEYLINQGKTK
jgi:hypothetical protein